MMYKHIMRRTQIYLKPTQIENLKDYAEKRCISVSEAIRELINNYFKVEGKESAGKFLIKEAKRAKEKGLRGPKDLAKNHDKYIYNS